MLLPMFWTNILPQSCDVTCSSEILLCIYHTIQHQIYFLQAVCFKDSKHIYTEGVSSKKELSSKPFFTCFLFSAPLLHTQSITTFFTNSTGKIIQILCCVVLCCLVCHTVLCCGVLCCVPCCTVLCCAVVCCAVVCCVVCRAVLCCLVLCCVVLCCVLYCAVLCCPLLCCAVPCCVLCCVVLCS
jgi:hypothetical protein